MSAIFRRFVHALAHFFCLPQQNPNADMVLSFCSLSNLCVFLRNHIGYFMLLKKISIRAAIIFTFVPLLCLSVLLILLVVKKTSEDGVYHIAKTTMAKNMDWTERYVQSIILPAQETGGYLSTEIAENSHGLTDAHLIDLMLERVRYADHLHSLYIGKPDGTFLLAGWRPLFLRYGNPKWLYVKRVYFAGSHRLEVEQWVDPQDRSHRLTQPPVEALYDPRVRPWFRTVAKEGRDQWTQPYIFYMTNKAGITFSSPIFSPQGDLYGIVGADIKIDTVSAFLNQNRFSTNSVNFLLLDDGTVISHPSLVDHLQENEIPHVLKIGDMVLADAFSNYLSSPEYRSADKYFAVIHSNQEKIDIVFKRHAAGNGYPLILGEYVPETDYLSVLRDAGHHSVLIGLILLGGFTLLSIYISRILSAPILELSHSVERVKNLDFQAGLLNKTKITEIGTTISSFNNMINSLQQNRQANQQLTQQLEESYLDTLYRLALAAEIKDKDTAGHLDRVSGYSAVIADELGLAPSAIETLRKASILHDVGKLAVPDQILLKKGRLTVEEYAVVKEHTLMGGKILQNPTSPLMATAQVIALSHHERWDGTGYPHGLSGENIPQLGAHCCHCRCVRCLIVTA